MKTRMTMTKAKKMIALAKINHLRAVKRRNQNKRGPLDFSTDWEVDAEIDYWQQYIEKLDGMD